MTEVVCIASDLNIIIESLWIILNGYNIMSETVIPILDTCSQCVLEVHKINCGFPSTHGTSAQLVLQKLYF